MMMKATSSKQTLKKSTYNKLILKEEKEEKLA